MRTDREGFLARLCATSAADPARLAVAGTAAALTYGALAGHVAGMAGWLLRAGLAPGQMAGVTIRDDVAHLVVTLALMRLGCHQVALGSHDPPELRGDLAARAGVVVVLGDGPGDALPDLPLLLPDHAAGADPSLAALVPDGLPEASAQVVLTSSGTTGRPKLIPLSQRAVFAQSARRRGLGAVRHRPVGLEHNNGMRFALHTLANGATCVLAEASRAIGVEAACRRFGIEMLGLSPYQAEALLARQRQEAWPARATIDLAGNAPGDGLVRRLHEQLTREVYVLYGTTEVGSVARAGPAEFDACPEGSGRVMPGAAVASVDVHGAALPAGEHGLIRIRTEGMAERYLGDAEATARSFFDGWFHTGDVGRLLPDGTLVVAGRADDMMILGTLNIFPAEIERVAAAFPGVGECAAFAVRHATLGDIPMLAATEVAPGALDVAALQAQCRARLGLRAPRRVVVVAALPRNAAGKVLRRELAAQVAG